MNRERIKKVWEEIGRREVHPFAFLVSNPRNIFYLTQFKGEGVLLITFKNNYLITDSRYTEQAKQEAKYCNILIQDSKHKNSQILSLTKILNELNIDELGFESNYLNVNNYLQYQLIKPKIKLFPFEDVIEKVRMVKDQSEISFLEQAARIADKAFLKTMIDLSPGVSEITIANNLCCNIRKEGASKESFDIIVVSGERSVLIHGQPTNKKIKEQELIIIDFGCEYYLYNSDCTRTLLLGKANKKQEYLFNILKEVQIKTLEKVKAGVPCSELDHFARNCIKEKGYADFFLHSLGHGVGLSIHELPRINQNDENILLPGMVITIEPGIYVPDIGGIRIEDTVVVTENGYKSLTTLPKELSTSI